MDCRQARCFIKKPKRFLLRRPVRALICWLQTHAHIRRNLINRVRCASGIKADCARRRADGESPNQISPHGVRSSSPRRLVCREPAEDVKTDAEWKSLILFGLYTGQRLGDLSRLPWQNVDLEERNSTRDEHDGAAANHLDGRTTSPSRRELARARRATCTQEAIQNWHLEEERGGVSKLDICSKRPSLKGLQM